MPGCPLMCYLSPENSAAHLFSFSKGLLLSHFTSFTHTNQQNQMTPSSSNLLNHPHSICHPFLPLNLRAHFRRTEKNQMSNRRPRLTVPHCNQSSRIAPLIKFPNRPCPQYDLIRGEMLRYSWHNFAHRQKSIKYFQRMDEKV